MCIEQKQTGKRLEDYEKMKILWKSLDNKYIQKLIASDELTMNNTIYLVMLLEYAENFGQELITFDGDTSLRIVLQTCIAIMYLHTNNIIQ